MWMDELSYAEKDQFIFDLHREIGTGWWWLRFGTNRRKKKEERRRGKNVFLFLNKSNKNIPSPIHLLSTTTTTTTRRGQHHSSARCEGAKRCHQGGGRHLFTRLQILASE